MNIVKTTDGYRKLLKTYGDHFEKNCYPSFQDLMWQFVINELHTDKTVVFHPIVDKGVTIGIVQKDTPGYWPTHVHFAKGVDYNLAMDILETLNEDLFGLHPDLCADIVISSMRKEKV